MKGKGSNANTNFKNGTCFVFTTRKYVLKSLVGLKNRTNDYIAPGDSNVLTGPVS